MDARALARTLRGSAAALVLIACSAPVPEAQETGPALEAEARAAKPSAQSAPPAAPARPHTARSEGAPATGYQYIDESGRVQVAARLEDVPERQRATVSALATARTTRRPEPTPADAPENHARSVADVTIYTTPTCGYCRRATAYLDKLGIDYVNKDVSADEEARAEYLELTNGRPGVPVIAVGDDWMQGWSQEHLDRLLASSR